MTGHDLIIDSLRDLQARCSCGGWMLIAPAGDDRPDGAIREKARAGHERHRLDVHTCKHPEA